MTSEVTTPAEVAPPAHGRSRLVSAGLIFASLLLVVVLGITLARRNETQPTTGIAPDFTLTTFGGETLRLSELSSQVVVLNFWASWCVPCRDEAPILQDAWERYRDRGVLFIGIGYADMESDALAFIEEFGITYPNGPDIGLAISDRYPYPGRSRDVRYRSRGSHCRVLCWTGPGRAA